MKMKSGRDRFISGMKQREERKEGEREKRGKGWEEKRESGGRAGDSLGIFPRGPYSISTLSFKYFKHLNFKMRA